MADGTGARPRRWRRRVAAVLLALLAALGVGEAAARLRFGAPMAERLPLSRIRAHPTRGWEMVPGEDHYTYLHRVEVNALGLRGPEVPPRSPEAPEVRVLALGDSLVYGQGVADDQTVPAHLEVALEELDPRGRRWRVVNGGHRAYDTAQELALLEELGPAIDPDVVVLFWYWNDLHAVDVAAMHAFLADEGPLAFDTRAPMEGAVRLRWQARQLLRRSALVMALHDLWKERGEHEAAPSVDALRPALERLGRQLARLRRLGRERGFRPVFAVVPDARGLLGDHASAELEAAARARAREAELPVVELVPPLRALAARGGAPPVLPYDGHYTGEANRAIARAVAEALLAHPEDGAGG